MGHPHGAVHDPDIKRLAIQVEDHALEYGGFEGIIPEGRYGAGKVLIWDEGRYEPLVDMETGLKKGSLAFCLYGNRLNAEFALVRIKKIITGKEWLLIKKKVDVG